MKEGSYSTKKGDDVKRFYNKLIDYLKYDTISFEDYMLQNTIYQVLFNMKDGIGIRTLLRYDDHYQKNIANIQIELKSDIKEVDGLLKIIKSFNET